MRKHSTTQESERKAFLGYCDTIKSIEGDKDRFLAASRLDRHESKREPLSPRDIIAIVAILGVTAILCVILVLGYLSGAFISAVVGVGVASFFITILIVMFRT